MPIRRLAAAATLAAAVAAATALAADGPAKPKPAAKPATKPTTAKSAAPDKDYWTSGMDYGPFLMTSVSRPAAKKYSPKPLERENVPKFPVDPMTDLIAGKGIVIPLGPRDAKGVPAATVCYDADTLAMAAAWTGGWLDLSGTMLTNHKGVNQVTMAGTELFRTEGVGCGGGVEGKDLADPRDGKIGPLPADRGRLMGTSVNGSTVVLRYAVGGADVLEVPGYEVGADGVPLVTRTIRVGPTSKPTSLVLATQSSGGTGRKLAQHETGLRARFRDGNGQVVSVGVRWLHPSPERRNAVPGNAVIEGVEDLIVLLLPKLADAQVLKVVLRAGPDDDGRALAAAVNASPDPTDPASHLAGGPSRYQPVTTTGKPGSAPAKSSKKAADPAFVVDEITLPFDNPSKSWLRLSGLDFFPDGRAAVCTINGDVWIASGLDEKLEKITWTRFATGLYHPMGLAIVDGEVYVRSRDFLLRLKDVNNDGMADSYEVVTAEGVTHPSYHGFVFDLQTDAAGNFYYARGGIGMDPALAGHGLLTKVSKDGKTVTPLAGGLRAPNGLGVVGNGWVTVSDNQGNWIPSSKVHLIDPAAAVSPGNPPFLGFLPHHHQPTMPKAPDRPFVWIPHKLDNSSGGQCQIPANAWGPYGGQWIHSSFGAACVTLLLPDDNTPAGQMPAQGAVVKLPLDFATGVMRPRFNPKDGQLYVAGVGGGWQTKGTADGGLYRVRFTGQPGLAPTRFALVPGGVRLTFAQPLDKTEATDVQNYAVEQWNYQWSEKYGSPDFSAKDPKKAGHDEVEVKAAELSGDGRTVTLKLGTQVVVDQLRIQCNLKTAAGAELEQEVFTTVNKVPTAGK